ncbi:MAG: 1-acyl-sn-glycerol-3-phosphate acyltransferase [Hyphomicrobiales bacterium]
MEQPEQGPPGPQGGMIRRWINRLLRGTRHYYRNVLPEQFGPLRATALRLFYSGIRLEDHQLTVLRHIPTDAVIIYASRFRATFPFLFAHTRYHALGLPFPRLGLGCRFFFWQPASQLFRVLIARVDEFIHQRRCSEPFGSGFIQDQLLRGQAGFLALIQRPSMLRRIGRAYSDPIEFLISLQKTIDRPVLLVPQIMFFSKNPRRSQPTLADVLFGPEDEPGRLRMLAALFKNPGNVFVELSAPIDLRRFVERPDIAEHRVEYQAAILRSEILAQISRHRQSITGPILKSRHELKQSILDGERFQQFIQTHAESHHLSLAEVRASAGRCIEEIAAAPSPTWIRFYSAIVGWILRTLFDGVTLNLDGLAAVKHMSLRGPVVYIPSHKSHVDYLILSYLLYQYDLPCPLIAAGKNLSFWPMGPLFRRGGAFFIRRSFRGAVLYSRTFAEYVHKILEEGYSVEQFIEGGRSRSGKLLMPKLGLLSILLTARRNGACGDLIFVPVSIGYDRVLEEKSYLKEIKGGQKRPETVWQVIKARKFLKRRYGKVYLQFSTPISVNDLADRAGTPLNAMSVKEFNQFCRSLGHRIARAIDRASVVTPHALAAAAILNTGRDRFDLEEQMAIVEIYANHLDALGVKLADTLVLDHRRAIARALESYVQRKILESPQAEPRADDNSTGFILREAKRPLLEYYKNTCVTFFVPAAFTALAILQRDAFQFSATDLHTDVEFLRELFQFEFVYDCDGPPDQQLRESLNRFIEDAVLVPHPSLPDTCNVTSAGFRKLKLYAMFLKTFLESYWVVLSYLRQAPHNEEEAKDRVKKIASFGARLFKNKAIEHREALSKVTYENAIEFCASQGIRGAGERAAIDSFAAAIERALRCLKP